MSPDVEDTTIGHGATGKKQMRRFVEASFANLPEVRFDFVRGHEMGDAYAIEWIMQPMGIPGMARSSPWPTPESVQTSTHRE